MNEIEDCSEDHAVQRIYQRFANNFDIAFVRRFIELAGPDPRYRLGPAYRNGSPVPGRVIYRVKHPVSSAAQGEAFFVVAENGCICTVLPSGSREEKEFRSRQREFRRLSYAQQLRWRLDAGLMRTRINPIDTGIVAVSLLKRIGPDAFAQVAVHHAPAGIDLDLYVSIGRRLIDLGSRVYKRIDPEITTSELMDLLSLSDDEIRNSLSSASPEHIEA